MKRNKKNDKMKKNKEFPYKNKSRRVVTRTLNPNRKRKHLRPIQVEGVDLPNIDFFKSPDGCISFKRLSEQEDEN